MTFDDFEGDPLIETTPTTLESYLELVIILLFIAWIVVMGLGYRGWTTNGILIVGVVLVVVRLILSRPPND